MIIEMQEALAKASSEETSPSEAEVTPEAVIEAEEIKTEAETKGEQLFETPDGRKLTAAELQVEWREKFLPDYTRKSQELAEIKKPKDEAKPNNPEKPEWEDPNWVPTTYGDIVKIAEQRALERIKSEEAQRDAQKKEVEQVISSQLAEIRKEEPNLNEDLLFQHANKYQFSDLKLAFQNMKEMKLAIKKTEEKVVSNMKSREADVINAGVKTGSSAQGTNYWEISNDRGSARDYLARVSK